MMVSRYMKVLLTKLLRLVELLCRWQGQGKKGRQRKAAPGLHLTGSADDDFGSEGLLSAEFFGAADVATNAYYLL